MGRIYVVPFTASITNAGGNTDLWEILPTSDKPCRILGISLGQISEVADAGEEGLQVSVKRLLPTVTGGTGGAAGAPEEVGRSGQAPGFASATNNTGLATTTGDTEVLDQIGWNNRHTPYERWYPDEKFAPAAIQGEALIVRLETTPADDFTFVGNIWIEEGP